MKSKATRLSVLLAALVGLAATVLPVAPAEAQWVFIARKAIGRIQLYEFDLSLERDGSYSASIAIPLDTMEN